MQLTVGRFGSASYTTSNGIAANQSSINSAVSRFGFNIGKDITEKTNVYLKADWLHEFGGSYAMTMTNIGGERSESTAVMAIPGLSTVSARQYRQVETTILFGSGTSKRQRFQKVLVLEYRQSLDFLKTEAAIVRLIKN